MNRSKNFAALTRGIALMGGGFLLSVLWIDLKFDVLAWSAMVKGVNVTVAELDVIKTYYLQATGTEGDGVPLIMSMMVLAVLASLMQLRQVAVPLAFRVIALLLVVPPILLAGVRIVPNARLLSVSVESAEVPALAEQSALAVSMLQDHLYCLSSIAGFLVIQLWITWRYPLR